MSILSMAILLVGLAPADSSPEEVAAHLAEARHAGWQMAHEILLPKLLPLKGQKEQYPGIAAFSADVEKAAANLNFKGEADKFPGIDCDSLVAKNPNFWRANYEIAPGDPAWMLFHAGLLLAGGEAARAQPILRLAKSRPGIPVGVIQGIDHLLGQSGRVIVDGKAAVKPGIARYDAGDHAGALNLYEVAIKQWPQNGMGHYEIGLTRMTERKGEPDLTPAVVASFALARKHDPLMYEAYQGGDPDVAERLQAVLRAAALYKKIDKGGVENPVTVKELISLSDDLQFVDQDELALVVRQMAVIRRGGFRPEDHPFLGKSLRRLVPGKETEAVLKRLIDKKPLALRQLTAVQPAKGK